MTGFICNTCGKYHDQIPLCFGLNAPALWLAIPESERQQRGEISSDQCVIDDRYFFILGRIVLPIVDGSEPFVWLAWVSLSQENFVQAYKLWNTEGREKEPPYFGWLQSALPSYEVSTLSLKVWVHTQPIGERPLIELEPTDHPLSQEQRHGITLARVQQIVEMAFHS